MSKRILHTTRSSGRDYWSKPIQENGRSTHDYGNTKLNCSQSTSGYTVFLCGVVGLLFVVALYLLEKA